MYRCFLHNNCVSLFSTKQVGAAVSMVYASGAPIMFLGCGQTYADLKRLHVKSVVNALLT